MDEQRQTFSYTGNRGSYLAAAGSLFFLVLLESSLILLCIFGLTEGTLRMVLVGLYGLLMLFMLRLLLGPLLTRHSLTPEQLELRYGTLLKADIPRGALVAALPVQRRLGMLQPLGASYEKAQRQLTACFSERGQVLLYLDQPRTFLIKRTGEVEAETLLINVDDRERLLSALALPERPPAQTFATDRAKARQIGDDPGILAVDRGGLRTTPESNPATTDRYVTDDASRAARPEAGAVGGAGGIAALALDQLTRRYGPFVAVDGLSLSVRRGEIYGFLGANGAGKTTTIKMLAGLLRPDGGRVWIAGHDMWGDPLPAKQALGYVPDRALLYERLTGRETLAFLAQLRELPRAEVAPRIERLLRLLELAEHADRACGSYSFGMKRKLALAGALLHQPRLLVLDEPLNGLDPRSARRIKDIFVELASEGCAVFLSTHDLATAESICDRVGILHRGRLIAQGSAAELRGLAAASDLEEVFLSLTDEAAEERP